MRQPFLAGLTILAISTAACNEAVGAPSAPTTTELANAIEQWSPAAVIEGLAVDTVTRERIEDGLTALHASLATLNESTQAMERLSGEARSAAEKDLEAQSRLVHQEHETLWNSLEPAVRDSLAVRLHAQMSAESGGSLQDRIKRLHGAPRH